jgi:hypothetical protein
MAHNSTSRRSTTVQLQDVVNSPVRQVPLRKIKPAVTMALVAASAGRCQFRGCPRFLFEHHVTAELGVFAEQAHICAFREGGPRGLDGVRPQDINSIENLMLLCAPCHKLVDDNPEQYPRALLQDYKVEHEKRIRWVTGLGPEVQTTVLQLKAKIGTSVVEVSQAEIFDALRPRYPAAPGVVVDVSGIGNERAGAFYTAAYEAIQREAERLYAKGSDIERTKHLSVFGLAPIPLLMGLGASLSNKVQTDFYQCHRDRSYRWTWSTGEQTAQYKATCLRDGAAGEKVALILSLSGTIDPATLPAHIDHGYSIYEISLCDAVPHTGFLRQREDLDEFRKVYRELLALLRKKHPTSRELHMFPAVPAPVAIACGFDLLPKVDPALVVYDNVQTEGGFVERLKVQANER